MVHIRPFRALRPVNSLVDHFTSVSSDLPYYRAVLENAQASPAHYLHIQKPQLFMPFTGGEKPDSDLGKTKLEEFVRQGYLVQDELPSLYLYRQTINGFDYTGLISLVNIKDYKDNLICKHENTRVEKEGKMAKLFTQLKANGSPVLLTHHELPALTALMNRTAAQPAAQTFTAENGAIHTIWEISQPDEISEYVEAFSQVDKLYIADGHHRSAAISRCSGYTNGLLNLSIPAPQLRILAFHRLIKDFRGLARKEFVDVLATKFKVKQVERNQVLQMPGIIHLYLKDSWFKIEIPEEMKNSGNPAERLDVSILEREVLQGMLGIHNTRTSSRVTYLNDTIGMDAIKEMVDTRIGRAAFLLAPLSFDELFAVSDAGLTLPPKSTWIEPKLRNGLVIQNFEKR